MLHRCKVEVNTAYTVGRRPCSLSVFIVIFVSCALRKAEEESERRQEETRSDNAPAGCFRNRHAHFFLDRARIRKGARSTFPSITLHRTEAREGNAIEAHTRIALSTTTSANDIAFRPDERNARFGSATGHQRNNCPVRPTDAGRLPGPPQGADEAERTAKEE